MEVSCHFTHPALKLDLSRRHLERPGLTVPLDGLAEGRAFTESRIMVLFDQDPKNDRTKVLVHKKGSSKTRIYQEPCVDKETQKVANLLFERLQDVYAFYFLCFGRRGMDNHNCSLLGYVMAGEAGNASYKEHRDEKKVHHHGRMSFGAGKLDGANFATSLDIVGHEATHGVIGHTTRLSYKNESGALNESLADCFGIMMKHWKLGQRDPEKADWELGSGILYPWHIGMRNLSEPGKHNQPSHYGSYDDRGGKDYGGVHHNSGIPNYAFYLAVMAVGGPSWETVGEIWYKTMIDKGRLKKRARFVDFAKLTLHHSPAEYRSRVKAAWVTVGVLVSEQQLDEGQQADPDANPEPVGVHEPFFPANNENNAASSGEGINVADLDIQGLNLVDQSYTGYGGEVDQTSADFGVEVSYYPPAAYTSPITTGYGAEGGQGTEFGEYPPMYYNEDYQEHGSSSAYRYV